MRATWGTGARAGGPRGGDGPADEVRPETRRRPEERVAFGHSGVAALRAEDEAAVAGDEAGLEQDRPERETATSSPSILRRTSSRMRPSSTSVRSARAAVTATAGSSVAGSVCSVAPPRSR